MKLIKLLLGIIIFSLLSYSCIFLPHKIQYDLKEEIFNSQQSLLNQDYLDLNTIYVRKGYGSTAIFIFIENNVYFRGAVYEFDDINDSTLNEMQSFLNPVAAKNQVSYYILQDSLIKYETGSSFSAGNQIYHGVIRNDTIFTYKYHINDFFGIKNYTETDFIHYKSIPANPNFIREIDSVAKIYLK